MASTEEFTKRL